MKKLILFSLIILGNILLAQNNNVQNAWNYRRSKDLDLAKKAIDAAAVLDDTKDKSKMYFYRAQVYLDIVKTKDERFANLDPEAPEKAFTAVINCLKTDKDKTFYDDVKGLLEPTAIYVYNKAAKLQGLKQYDKAFEVTKLLLDGIPYDKDDVLKHQNITVDKINFQLYRLAMDAKNNALAKEYLEKLIKINYNQEVIYVDMADISMAEKDTAKALGFIEQGLKRFNESEVLISMETEIYMHANKMNELLDKFKADVESNPENPILYYNLGFLYKQKGDFTNAENAFLKTLELQPTHLEATHSLGVIYLKKGSELADEAEKLPPSQNKKADELTNKSQEYYKKAIPYLERFHESKPKVEVVSKNLITLYLRVGDTEKADKLKAEITKK